MAFSRLKNGSDLLLKVALALVIASTFGLNCGAQAAVQIQQSDEETKASGTKTDQPEQPTEIIVKGDAKRSKADRDVYGVDKSATSAADALNKVPGVAVLSSGDVTLHGRHAEIYVDGHPSLLLAGDNRGLALRSMPSSYIKSIEVISTPGVQFDAQGSGGIINIVTNHGMPNGRFGSASVRANALGGGMGSLTYSENRGKFSGSFTGNINNDVASSKSSNYMSSPATSLDLRNLDIGRSSGTGVNIMSSLAYDVTPRDVIKGELNYFGNRTRFTSRGNQISAMGLMLDAQKTVSTSQAQFNSPNISGTWVHYGDKPDETLRVYVNAARQASSSESLFARSGANDLEVDRQSNNDNSVTNRSEGSADYTVPIGEEQLSLGAKLTTEGLTSNYSSETSSIAGLVNQRRFISRQIVSALYVHYQVELGAKWTVLGGLRYEQTNMSMAETGTTDSSGKANYGNLTPGLFATYVISNDRKLRFSLTERLERPNPADMLPFTEYIDQNRVRIGNPRLQPQKTTTIDSKYEFGNYTNTFAVRTFYTEDNDIISPVSFTITDPLDLGKTVVALAQANVGARRSFGTEVTFGKTIFKKVNLSGTVDAIYQDLSRVPGAPVSQALTVGGNLVAFYSFPKGDSVSVVATVVPRAISAVGYTRPYVIDSLSYSRALTPKLGLNISVNNVLRMSKIRSVVNTPTLKSSFNLSQASPTIMISLNRSFGGFDTPNK